MSKVKIQGVKIAGLAACVPKMEVSNLDLELIQPKERDLLIRTTGIHKKRQAQPGQCTSDLCFESADKLLDELNWNRDEIQFLIFVTQTPDYITPATAAILQSRLGLSRNCMAFDINLGCSGYVYGLNVLGSLISTSVNGKGLLLAGDVSTACISHQDKSVYPIFGDAGTATAVKKSTDTEQWAFNCETDGAGFEKIIIRHGGYRQPVEAASLVYEEVEKGVSRNKTHLELQGIDIFNFSVREVPQNIKILLEDVGQSTENIDYFVFHQANLLINETIRKKLKLTKEQVPYSLQEFGNTSSATIPLTMVTQLREQLSQNKLNLVLSGFGVGLSWASAFLPVKPFKCLQLIEL